MSRSAIISDCIISPMGIGSGSNWDQMLKGQTGIGLTNLNHIELKDFYSAAIGDLVFDEAIKLAGSEDFSRFETLALAAIRSVVQSSPVPFDSPKTGFVFSTTKGNIDLFSQSNSGTERKRTNLFETARILVRIFNNPNVPYVVSNACVSGISAIILADTLIRSKKFEQVVVCGCDILSEFTTSGFNCLHAISPFPCRPFDAERAGLSPGEAVGVIVLANSSITEKTSSGILISGGSSSNDANHISGPSRTGEGLSYSISEALKKAKLTADDIGYICTHGTATIYNDESEALAISSIDLSHVSLNSLKGYFGHTFGAAGIIETIISCISMKKSRILPSLGYSQHGVSVELNIANDRVEKSISHTLKTASGFGGCNAAIILSQS